ncbi:MAG: polyphenol oxidase family protein, partial [Bacilli bacterium]
SDVMLFSLYADCVPLYFFDPVRKAIGLAHAGWKGTCLNICERMYQTFIDRGSVAEDIHMAIGPHIGNCCYEVDEHVAQQFIEKFSYAKEYLTKNNEGYKLDLGGLNAHHALDCGLKKEHIFRGDECTSCNVDRYFSFRKENGKTGRMGSFLMIRK